MSPNSKKWVAKTIGQSFSEYSFLGEHALGRAWVRYSARAVPAQCPHSARDSARLEFIAVPAVPFFCKRKGETFIPLKINKPRALL